MSQDQLKLMLKQWFDELLQTAPQDDPRRTPECLSFADLLGIAEQAVELQKVPIDILPTNKVEHVAGCSWCRSALENACRVVQAEPKFADTSSTQWARLVGERLSEWVQQRAQQSLSVQVARFDEHGTFCLDLDGLPNDGPVQISLLWEGVQIRLAEGVVNRGRLQLRKQLARIGLRNIWVPAHLLVIEPSESK